MILALLTPVGTHHYRISLYSFRGNYSFLNLKIVENLSSCHLFQFFTQLTNLFLLFKGGNYLREETIRGNTVSKFVNFLHHN